MSDSATLWTVAHLVPLSMGILQARILEWVVMPSSRGSSWLRHLPALAAGFFTTSATSQPIPVFAGAQGNQTATLSSFSHRLYCLNIFHYDFFGQTLILQNLHSMWLGHFTPHLIPNFHEEVFPPITNCLTVTGFLQDSPSHTVSFFFLIWNLAVDSLLILGLLHPQCENLMLTEKWKWSLKSSLLSWPWECVL